MTITEFLTARLDEDEAAARENVEYEDNVWETAGWLPPSRVLAEVEAKRRIVEEADRYSPELEYGDNGEWAFEVTLRLLALPYADHPDYDEAWRP
jgi:hypothetical protein